MEQHVHQEVVGAARENFFATHVCYSIPIFCSDPTCEHYSGTKNPIRWVNVDHLNSLANLEDPKIKESGEWVCDIICGKCGMVVGEAEVEYNEETEEFHLKDGVNHKHIEVIDLDNPVRGKDGGIYCPIRCSMCKEELGKVKVNLNLQLGIVEPICLHEKTEIRGNSIYCVECGTKLKDVPSEEIKGDIMYRIALQLTPATPNKPATFQYLTDKGVEPWGVEDLTEALDRYNKELDNYKRSIITLVHIVDVECELKADPCCVTPTDPGVEDPGTTEPTPEVITCPTCGKTEGVVKKDDTTITCPDCGDVTITA